MIYTSNYKNCNTKLMKTYSISKDKGEDANYKGDYFLLLAPPEDLFRTWKNNIGKIPEEENNQYYIREYYYRVLKLLDPEEVYKKLKESILLCYEDNDMFCHRHIVSAWLEYYLNIKSYEVKVEDEKIDILPRPEYIKDYLYQIIDEDTKEEENALVKTKILQND